jgi:hypothetical protein
MVSDFIGRYKKVPKADKTLNTAFLIDVQKKV